MNQRTRGRLLRLRSNLVLLLVVCGTLLAAPAIVMALITDLGGNTPPTIQSEGADVAEPERQPAREHLARDPGRGSEHRRPER